MSATTEATLTAMGLKRPYIVRDEVLARRMRRLCNGKFGNMSDTQWNARVPGTGGSYRGSVA